MKKVLGLAVAMAAASQANAAINLPSSDVANTGGSELVLVVYDDVSKTTYTRDLGIDYRAFNSSNAYSFAADARLSSLFGSTLNSSLVWGVWASDSVDTGAADASGAFLPNAANTWGASIMTTSTAGIAGLSTITAGNVANANAGFTNFVNATNTLVNGTHSQADGSSTAIEGQNANSANFGYTLKSNWANLWPVAAATNVGSNAYFVMAQSLYTEESVDFDEDGVPDLVDYVGDNANPAAYTEFAGLWNLSANGVLSWSATTTEVPVPAAAWLFASGLAGLAGVARRRKAA